jgi:hypothetical protein
MTIATQQAITRRSKASVEITLALLNAKHDLTRDEYARLLADVSSYCTGEIGELAEVRRPYTPRPVWEGDDPTQKPSW